MKQIFVFVLGFIVTLATAQDVMTPEQLIQLKKVSGQGISIDGQHVIFSSSQYQIEANTSKTKHYKISLKGGEATEISFPEKYLEQTQISPDGTYELLTKSVKLEKVTGDDFYEDVPESDVKIYTSLNYRHWDEWQDGKFNHVFYKKVNGDQEIDIMPGEAFDSPTEPFGGSEDYIWNPEGTEILYVSKKLSGADYAISTNTDIYAYNLETKETRNLTPDNKGYDTAPAYSSKGNLGWLQMARDGYESDKNDIVISKDGEHINLTAAWDGTVNSFQWADNGKSIYFVAPTQGTVQLFEIKAKANQKPHQITDGQFDVQGIIGQNKRDLVIARQDMNHASELYIVNSRNGKMQQLTHQNDDVYDKLTLGKIEKRMTETTDGQEMLSWVAYPPNFDKNKKYPTLLYCQGGPQGALSQFYSFRWNFQLMAAEGYIVIAPNRRGMPGYGVEWNEQISKDYGGQNMEDYLAAIDDIAEESYVDESRLACVGASYGGYSAFYLAGHHNKRFKSFIAHDGIFNWQSMYGTTEEMFFVNWDLGGPYWEKDNAAAQKSYDVFNPVNYVQNWDTPILIIQGGRDFRVPIGQGLEAFQAAQLQGIKSKLLYFPKENHWVLDGQNSLIWQREFYKWLGETL
ncbi:MAG: S9 family peptidase [Psychroflexus sp.]|nr:S9 family peptidase [Psychroflexus sp.]MDN6309250.1 S9 family peptidase [Psychroflexus sp.]